MLQITLNGVSSESVWTCILHVSWNRVSSELFWTDIFRVSWSGYPPSYFEQGILRISLNRVSSELAEQISSHFVQTRSASNFELGMLQGALNYNTAIHFEYWNSAEIAASHFDQLLHMLFSKWNCFAYEFDTQIAATTHFKFELVFNKQRNRDFMTWYCVKLAVLFCCLLLIVWNTVTFKLIVKLCIQLIWFPQTLIDPFMPSRCFYPWTRNESIYYVILVL